MVTLGEVHQACMQKLIEHKHVPVQLNGGGLGVGEFLKREANLVITLLIQRSGVDAGPAFAAADLGNIIRGAASNPASGVQTATDEHLVALHEEVINQLLGPKQQQLPAKPALAVQGKHTAQLADAQSVQITIGLG